MGYRTILAHTGGLAAEHMWVVVPMAIISVVLMVVLARPKAPPPGKPESRLESRPKSGRR
ncbi:hypothetical protein [Allorhizocola rhizosphaerae]|uniref:hypothetical protein n=1 Tax=Allorhizocola rhizosphaerae TaxID=1872709 RepID=UPI000E3D45A9|nr:hypothetical protein [Allorhizocola rhizosphaerae]